jgi:dTDP-4-amino-4,6-dideoxygalactose transaminase
MIRLAVPFIGDEEVAAVERVMRSGQLSQGPETAAFEEEFSQLVDGRHCIGVNSGTSALHVALLAAGIGPGDEVIVPSFTFAATANSVALTGATPVFVDIEPTYFCIDPQAVAAAVTSRTAAIMPVHLYGHPAQMPAILEIADRHGLLVIEDSAQAHGASLNGTPVGAFGTLGAFSFYPTKNMTTGEGGMITTADDELARKCRLLRAQGMEIRYQNEMVGLNVRMTDMAAAIGRVQLTRLAAWTAARRANAQAYDAGLTGVTVPAVEEGAHHVYHQYTIRSTDRDGLLARLREQDIGCDVYYPTPVHELPSFGREIDLPVTALVSRQVLSIPVHPFLTADERNRIIEVINQ